MYAFPSPPSGKEFPGKVQPRLKFAAWFLKSKCTKYCKNVQHVVKKNKIMLKSNKKEKQMKQL